MVVGMMQPQLTEGCLRAMLQGVQVNGPVVQLIESRQVNQNRYRVCLNDGRNTYSFVMLATQLNPMMERGEIPPLSVIRVNKYSLTQREGNKTLIILLDIAMELNGTSLGNRIGNPTPVPDGSAQNVPASGQNASAQIVPAQPNSPARQPFRGSSSGFGGQNNSWNSGGNQGSFPNPPAKRPNLGQNVGQANNFGARAPGGFGGGTTMRPQQPTYPNATSNRQGGFGAGARFPNGQQQFGGQHSGMDAGSAPGDDGSGIIPISALNPYNSGRWTICAKVLSREPIKEWQKGDRSGRVFGALISDGETPIKCSAFNDDCDKFYDLLEVGKDVYISGGVIKTADSRFSQGRLYDMTLGSSTEIRPCHDPGRSVNIQYNFVPIENLQGLPSKTSVDVIGIVRNIAEIFEGTSKTSGKGFKKRDLELVDRSGYSVRCSLWGSKVDTLNKEHEGSVIVAKNASVSDFGGCSLSLQGETMIQIAPAIPEAYELTGWLEQNGNAIPAATSISQAGGGLSQTEWRTLLDANSDNTVGEKGLYFMCRATIMKVFYKPNTMYAACPKCNKKMTMNNTDTYHCEQCSSDTREPKWRLMLQVELADFTGSVYSVIFDGGEKVLNQTQEQLAQLKMTNEAEFEKACTAAQFKTFKFKIRAKMENWQDEQRKKFMVVTVDPVDFVEESARLATELEKMGISPHV